MRIIEGIDFAIAILFFLCYFYQLLYIPIPWIRRMPPHGKTRMHRYAVLISARNEEIVLPQLIASIQKQTYDPRLLTIFVIADNCTDRTAEVARSMGAIVYERFNAERVGKGYALDELLRHIAANYPDSPFDGYFIFDADNVLSADYVEEMNKTFSDGFRIVTSYRNSKNYGDNWISAGYSLWFMREAKYLNNARMLLGTSCAVSGTGFLVAREIMDQNGGWPFFLLTEDIQFTVDSVLKGEKIGYCPAAVFYDEQPTRFRQAWRQRLRWSKGFLQVFRRYGASLVSKSLRGSFAAYDLAMTIMPAMLLSFSALALNLIAAATGLFTGSVALVQKCLLILAEYFSGTYLTLFVIGLITCTTEWRQIHAPARKKIFYLFTFPLFMLTYIPIAFTALFKRVTWQPIEHKEAKTVEEILSEKRG